MGAKRIGRKEVYKGKIFTIVQDEILFDDGSVAQWDLVVHNGASAVVPITENKEVILVKQYRNAKDGYVLEIPAGKLEKGEDPLECAKRELEEEIGFKAGRMTKICSMFTAVGFSDERLHLYMAEQLQVGKQNLDEDEYIEVVTYPITKAVEMIFKGEICDSKTIAGLLAVENLLRYSK
ncbi:NUDIX hydrolase [Niameybacter massiliensis]|uniref:NUDIX hydrolase n=1 Tax=Holtiella tumoricola TaxID=3018743 RepID=A0AA42DNX6_9FIRM|nr:MULTISPECIES: NUDIX hydrolase [Lachnospirales]MDA3732579.1 NUDIX hydrolase [Holtiella tumoricola]